MFGPEAVSVLPAIPNSATDQPKASPLISLQDACACEHTKAVVGGCASKGAAHPTREIFKENDNRILDAKIITG